MAHFVRRILERMGLRKAVEFTVWEERYMGTIVVTLDKDAPTDLRWLLKQGGFYEMDPRHFRAERCMSSLAIAYSFRDAARRQQRWT